jgi:predicted pyridoxine 5'-phosphate oxidase superfamily flavin-nucleotide-binding protein
MSHLYAEPHRALQDTHGTRALADLLDVAIIHDTLTDQDRGFIAAQDMLFLSTVDPEGRPTVSYKGGAPGFVRCEGDTLVFPCYDGNGMFYSMGNLSAHPQVGLLFIDFATPNRLRIQGEAAIEPVRPEDAMPGALFLVRVRPTQIFPNCGRYIHPQQARSQAIHVPAQDGSQPVAAWKRIDIVQGVLPAPDREAAEAAGLLTMDQYGGQVAAGLP